MNLNKTYTNQVLRLLTRLMQEYEINPNDPRYSSDEQAILQQAAHEGEFYGVKYKSLRYEVEARPVRESQRSAKGK